MYLKYISFRSYRFVLVYVFFCLTGCAESNFSGKQPAQIKSERAYNQRVAVDPDTEVEDEARDHGLDDEMLAQKPLIRESASPLPADIDTTQKNPKRIEQIFKKDGHKVEHAVDVVFAMDTSVSMADEKAVLEKNMANFVKNFEDQAKTIDYRIYMIGEGFKFPGTGDKIIKINYEIGSFNALSVLTSFINGKLRNPNALRPESSKQIIVITDDNAQAVTAPQFKNLIANTNTMAGKTSFNAIVGFKRTTRRDNCSVDNVGSVYMELAGDRDIGGLLMDICQQDWDQLLKKLAIKIINEVGKTEFRLDHPASLQDEILLFVDGKAIDAKNFSYDPATQMIKLLPDLSVPIGSEIKVSYLPQAAAN